MFSPTSTYRVQFHAGFTFHDFESIISYLHRLGIRTIYASPIFKAVPGSMHGYDGIDPNEINPEIGTLEDLRRISKRLIALDMKWIQDIVPNHMAYHAGNAWLMDVLKYGEASRYRSYFDILSEDLDQEPLMAPFLGEELRGCIENGHLKLVEIENEWFIQYADQNWPLRPGTRLDDSLQHIAETQFYRLCSYTESNSKINYRRFFTVNSLICINMQHEWVFEHYHSLVKTLLAEGIFHGLRIDHADGLFDPSAYLHRLRQLCGDGTYLIVEKILEPGESLPADWPIHGTTGYDYLGLLNQLFTNSRAEGKFSNFYKNMQQKSSSITAQIRKKKEDFLYTYMQGELDNLCALFLATPVIRKSRPDGAAVQLYREIIANLLIRCPVYRYYGNRFPLAKAEKRDIVTLLKELEESPAHIRLIKLVRKVLFKEDLLCYQRLMQFSGPLMAKGVEDTLMYTYNRFIGNNEVGDSPVLFGIEPEEFHEAIQARFKTWPISMNATATHDTKRGEDARARLSVLTDIRHVWIHEINRWEEINAGLLSRQQPDKNDVYFIYQTLVATYPENPSELPVYYGRLQAYMEKALRESKRNTAWEKPDLDYEMAVRDFITGLLDPQHEFLSVFESFMQGVLKQARVISLSSLIVKFGTPGIPDTYQGTELWDLSMVDPDNRRPVDYNERENILKAIENGELKLQELWKNSWDGKIKFFLLYQLLQSRLRNPDLYASGSYIPLKASGKYEKQIFSFARRLGNRWAIYVVPLNPALLPYRENGKLDWEDTVIMLPDEASGTYRELIHGTQITISGQMELSTVLPELPFAVLEWYTGQRQRGAGVLMHISSLPTAYGIGDLGPSAVKFLGELAKARQQYWQILPLNPVTPEQLYSPYASTSAMAGNVLLISPEWLQTEGLLNEDQLISARIKDSSKINFPQVQRYKQKLLKQAFHKFLAGEVDDQLGAEFDDFCNEEQDWLDDYACFEVIKQIQQQPWYHWPENIRLRDAIALAKIIADCPSEIQEVKWGQFLFFKQWYALKRQANALEIKIIGDLPFYCALDSVDVWVNPHLFCLDRKGRMKGVAGVPPDYFNADGQLWGMPVYNWKVLAKTKYEWWRKRIAQNRAYFDLIRLDHFRAFQAYWEVPAQAVSARHGVWKPGPGAHFFKVLLQNQVDLPFIAEDLGEITEGVINLREQFKLPGMRVLQFAFGTDAPQSVHSPHNFNTANCLVYTGTHDNNTIKGWFTEELTAKEQERVEAYTGKQVSVKNIHQVILEMAYATVAKIVVIPIQDVLGKGSQARMNIPASTEGNWCWKMKTGELKSAMLKYLQTLALRYGR